MLRLGYWFGLRAEERTFCWHWRQHLLPPSPGSVLTVCLKSARCDVQCGLQELERARGREGGRAACVRKRWQRERHSLEREIGRRVLRLMPVNVKCG